MLSRKHQAIREKILSRKDLIAEHLAGRLSPRDFAKVVGCPYYSILRALKLAGKLRLYVNTGRYSASKHTENSKLILKMTLAGRPIKAIQMTTKFSRNYIRKVLNDAGVPTYKQRIAQRDRDLYFAVIEEGRPLDEVARLLDLSPFYASKRLKQLKKELTQTKKEDAA